MKNTRILRKIRIVCKGRVPPGPLVFLIVGLGYLALAQYVIFLNDPVYLGAGFWPVAGLTLGAALIRRFGNSDGSLVPVRNLMVFLAFGVILAPLVGASIGTVGSVTIIGNPFWQVWPKYVVGDALGVLVIGLTAVSILAFRNWPDQWDVVLPYLIVPLLTWAALRFGVRGAAWSVLLTANVANIATAVGYGPFAMAGEPTGHAITLLQIFLAITAVTALILAALVDDLTDRRKAEQALRANEAKLREQAEPLDQARDAIMVLDMERRVRFWNRGRHNPVAWKSPPTAFATVARSIPHHGTKWASVTEHLTKATISKPSPNHFPGQRYNFWQAPYRPSGMVSAVFMETIMTKGRDTQHKEGKKKPEKTLKEKRADKAAKKAGIPSGGRINTTLGGKTTSR